MTLVSRLKLLTLFLIALPVLSAVAMENFQGVSPLEWQVVKLQESIEKKIMKSLNPVIKEDEYIIEVKIGVDKDALEDPSSKNITKTKQASKVRFSTEEMQKDGDDYVVFSKLGLEAPVFGDEAVELQTSDAEMSQKAFIEINDRYNLFKYLKTIDINLTFDSGLNQKSRDVIKKVVQGLSFNINEVLPQINIQYLDLRANQIKSLKEETQKAQAKEKEAEKKTPKFYEFFKNLDVMIGLILAAAILGLSFYLITKVVLNALNEEDEEEKEEELAEPVAEEILEPVDEENLDNIDEGDDMKLDLTKTDALTNRINEGLERLKKALTNHHDDTILMIKGWIKSRTPAEVNALSALIIVSTDSELATLFKTLTNDERATWRAVLHSELTKEEVSNSFVYISNKITEMMLVPSLINDYETCDLLLDISPKDAAKFCEENIDLGVVFTNVLSSNVISEMFKIVSPDIVAELIDKSADFQPERLPELLPALKLKLEQVKAKREKPPFLKRIIEILPTANADIETKLYSTLIKHFMIDEVKMTALKIFPKVLVPKIAPEVFKAVVELMPIETQVQYFASLESSKRDEKLDTFASKGSKGREMIDAELSPILKNEILLKRIQTEKRAKLEQEFISYTRQLVSTNLEIQREVLEQVESWLHGMKEDDHELAA